MEGMIVAKVLMSSSDLIKDYDPGINYYPGGVNVVVNAWS
jgi:hypothetical protein